MLVVVVDESAKRARIRSRRILAKWLPQVGSSVWMGTLSKEGIEQMHDELRSKASKNASVCCFLVRSSKRAEKLWTVGASHSWNEMGWFSYSQSENILFKANPDLSD